MPLYELLLRHALKTVMWATLPVVLAGIAGGLAVGLFQSLTQINDSTFSLVPKLAIAFVILGLLGRWMIAQDLHLLEQFAGHIGYWIDQPWDAAPAG